MSYQEKRTIVSVVTGILLLAAYCIYAFASAGLAGAEGAKPWAVTMLIFIGIGAAATIVIQIVFHILLSVSIAVKKQIREGKVDDKEVEKEIKSEMVEDERDKQIGLRSTKVAFTVSGVGFVAALVSLVLGFSVPVMLNILFLSFMAGAIIEGFVQMHYYRKGI